MLIVYFVLQRHTGYYSINFYLPCTLVVLLSWVGFWINREATADRIGLGETSSLRTWHAMFLRCEQVPLAC